MYKFLSWTAVLLWMALIINFSSQVAEQSNQLSTGITEIIVKTVEKIAPEAEFDIKSFNHIIRKNAHFFVYLILGILVINALRRSGVHGYRSVVITVGVCALYAISDEIHQLFVPGRGGQVKDVFIDSAGASVGVGFYWVVSRLVKGKKVRIGS
ncbi:VanZ like family protein [Sporotomaculum syntrophicum]|uniref:VanZ like family protein n=1 Tax=Sporotomaculum syntrophicum TaxID=182264 RepID=A0A9D2WSV1_9FIRM|nr:VanZ family protein [Sporotomaculum syntrophicum]KAF1086286.1 VanZ like family protein [Sporotomaculum syntrophicum]